MRIMNHSRNTSPPKRRQLGFSLLEVMISIAILSIGLLGLARLQATGLFHNQSAYQVSQATVLAYDIADRMRSNTSTTGNYLTSFMTLAAATAAGAVEGCTTTSGCSGTQMAQTDLQEWSAALSAALPNPTGLITQTGGTNITITINWDYNRDGSVDGNDINFQVSFLP